MMDEKALQELAAHIEMKRSDDVVSTDIAFGELTITITSQSVAGFVEFLRDDPNCMFSSLVDITAIDWPERPERFDMVWQFLSMYRNQRIRVKAAIREESIEQLDQAIDELKSIDREVITLRHFELLDNKEVAEVLGITEKAASIRYIRAIKRLKQALPIEPDQEES